MREGDIPGTVLLNIADLQRIASAAALDAARAVRAETHLSKDDVEEIVSESLTRFCERCGLPTDKEGFEAFKLDLSSMRSARETRQAILRHGWGAVITILVSGVLTALWVGILTMFKK